MMGKSIAITPAILPPMTAPVSVEDKVSREAIVGTPAMIKILSTISTLDLCGGKYKTKQNKNI